MRVLFYVQNLLGIGHVVRALRIASAIADRGGQVDLVLGGAPVEGLAAGAIRVTQLPPIKAGPGGFSDLVDAAGRPVDAAFKMRRRDTLLGALETVRPDVVLIEAYPFGRRQMRFELMPLIARARTLAPRPLVVSSIRDILQEGRAAGRDAETIRALRDAFDHVIVHADPGLVRLEATFPRAGEFATMTSYSGLVGPERPDAAAFDRRSAHAVVVSAGGGAVGTAVLRAALEAKPMTRLNDRRWLAVTGPGMAGADAAAMTRLAGSAGADVIRFAGDLPDRLARAELSISQAGYNTVADVLAARCRAVLVPFAADGETEQTRRAELLAGMGLAVTVAEHTISPERLAEAIDRAMALPEAASNIALDGANRTAAILSDLLSRHRG